MNKTSLRALGALSLVEKHGTKDPEKLVHYVTDSKQNIVNSIREAESAGMRSEPIEEPQEDDAGYGQRSLELRIFNMFCVNKAYETIAWFLTESGLGSDTSDEYLKGIVRYEYNSALAVRLWDKDVVKSAFYEVKSKKRGEHIFMKDILECLEKRSRGYE